MEKNPTFFADKYPIDRYASWEHLDVDFGKHRGVYEKFVDYWVPVLQIFFRGASLFSRLSHTFSLDILHKTENLSYNPWHNHFLFSVILDRTRIHQGKSLTT